MHYRPIDCNYPRARVDGSNMASSSCTNVLPVFINCLQKCCSTGHELDCAILIDLSDEDSCFSGAYLERQMWRYVYINMNYNLLQ